MEKYSLGQLVEVVMFSPDGWVSSEIAIIVSVNTTFDLNRETLYNCYLQKSMKYRWFTESSIKESK